MSYDFIVTRYGVEIERFEDQQTDLKPFSYLLKKQSQSVDYALKHGGWGVKERNNDTGKIRHWKPYTSKKSDNN